MFGEFSIFSQTYVFQLNSSVPKLIPLSYYVVFHHTVNFEKILSNISEILQ